MLMQKNEAEKRLQYFKLHILLVVLNWRSGKERVKVKHDSLKTLYIPM